jgi:hypothetical protein
VSAERYAACQHSGKFMPDVPPVAHEHAKFRDGKP